MIYFSRSDCHDNDCRQLHCLWRRLHNAGLVSFFVFVFNVIGIDPWSLNLASLGMFSIMIMTLIMMILYYFIDHCGWNRSSQGVTLGVFSIMYLILVILMTRSFLNEVGLALIVIKIISLIIIVIIIIITVILIIIVTVITVIVTAIVTVITIVIVNIIISLIVIVIVTVIVIVITSVTMTVIRCTWSSSPMLSSHPSLA